MKHRLAMKPKKSCHYIQKYKRKCKAYYLRGLKKIKVCKYTANVNLKKQ